jgi:hypothetical protein
VYLLTSAVLLFLSCLSLLLARWQQRYLHKRRQFLNRNPLSISDFPSVTDSVTYLTVMLKKKYGVSADHWLHV